MIKRSEALSYVLMGLLGVAAGLMLWFRDARYMAAFGISYGLGLVITGAVVRWRESP